ncbi:Asp23/Gls24 family envelope stress response protein [Microbacterium arabinogalactanolyticum]|uniref:Asp23/Gls24 family envelope stress response protein n=1 Tax=Microbacterium arabinogalactanolyticum TaxID=69365 RepID=A0ABQ5ND16_9MICO|nr:Asp23/Gls24 family envelope stress response protein [Microbacterium arabinogalactanolyticum]GLC83558.1 hypothetical protein MIAR_01460 [Microbacterium arabinogalactanolyticum]
MNEHDTPDARILGLEPEDLDGHTIEELSDYLEAGCRPPDPAIDESPGCRIALEALERLRRLSPELLAADAEAEPEPDDSWVQRILSGIALDAHAGRRIPITVPVANADLGITEGAVRGLIRATENALPGVLIGKSRFDGDVTVPGEPVRIQLDVSVPYGEPIPGLVDRLRHEIDVRLRDHTTLHITAVDITVHDVRRLPDPAEEDR